MNLLETNLITLMQTITLLSDDKSVLDKAVLKLYEKGFRITKAKIERHLFKRNTYEVKMRNVLLELNEAVVNENYELAGELNKLL
ncbi:MAG: hypothetical protein WC401_03545 [Bacteroidales bacterium]